MYPAHPSHGSVPGVSYLQCPSGLEAMEYACVHTCILLHDKSEKFELLFKSFSLIFA